MSRHTTGQWKVSVNRHWKTNPFSVTVSGRYSTTVANIPSRKTVPVFEQEANAHLIAAAPDLLDALIKARHYVSINRNSMVETCTRPNGSMHIDDEKIVAEYDAVLEQIDTALSKAT